MVAALGMPGPTSRMTPKRITDVSAALIEAAGAISRRLGWQGRSSSSVTSLAAR
jgi:DNA-binding IclR family transcriptional regulator